MKISPFPSKREKSGYFLALDIGTEAVKALRFKKENTKNVILGSALEYFEQFGVFDSQEFEKDVLKKTLSRIRERMGLFEKKEPSPVLLSLAPDIFKGRIISQSIIRKNPKEIIDKKTEKEIYAQINQKSQKELTQIWAKETGILPRDVQFINFDILEIKIDGYRVPGLEGLNGKRIDFKILATFLPKYYLDDIQEIAKELNWKIAKIIHEAELLQYFLESQIFEGLFLDIGGKVSQIFLTKEKRLERVGEIKTGGESFSRVISEEYGMSLERARELKHRYAGKLLSDEVRRSCREKFWSLANNWFLDLKSKLLEEKTLILPNIFLLGGGSLLPEIEEILTEGNWQDVPLGGEVLVKFLCPENLKHIIETPSAAVAEERFEEIKDNPQYTLTSLMVYALQEKNF